MILLFYKNVTYPVYFDVKYVLCSWFGDIGNGHRLRQEIYIEVPGLYQGVGNWLCMQVQAMACNYFEQRLNFYYLKALISLWTHDEWCLFIVHMAFMVFILL